MLLQKRGVEFSVWMGPDVIIRGKRMRTWKMGISRTAPSPRSILWLLGLAVGTMAPSP